jgi:hypothetical protein
MRNGFRAMIAPESPLLFHESHLRNQFIAGISIASLIGCVAFLVVTILWSQGFAHSGIPRRTVHL